MLFRSLERVAKLGHMGEVVKVKDGYARNFLLREGKALRATDANKAKFERDRAALEARNAERRAAAGEEAKSLEGRLNNPAFVEKAKPEAVEKARADHAMHQAEAERLAAALARRSNTGLTRNSSMCHLWPKAVLRRFAQRWNDPGSRAPQPSRPPLRSPPAGPERQQ